MLNTVGFVGTIYYHFSYLKLGPYSGKGQKLTCGLLEKYPSLRGRKIECGTKNGWSMYFVTLLTPHKTLAKP